MKCTQYGFCEQGAFKNARAILFFIHIYIIYFGGGGVRQGKQQFMVGIKKFMPKGAKLQAMALTHLPM